MTRSTCAVASRKRRKRILKLAKGFYGDRKNHVRLTKDAVMKALSFKYIHRKKKKADFKKLWVIRINSAARMNGISYSRLICGMKKANCIVNRKVLAELALNDLNTFNEIASQAKKALTV
ncbi:MAG: 50S ribosomal protein L20 [Parachlamydiales bacterium]|jgi:large subunit ribosomal protein L20